MNSDDIQQEILGYKRPPSWARFKKGQSGNPKGRPRKKAAAQPIPVSDSQIDEILLKELARIIKVNDAGGAVEMSALLVVIRSLLNNAMKGNVHAQKAVLQVVPALEAREAERVAQRKTRDANVFDYVVGLKRAREQVWAAAEGGEPEQPWPHPDDMLIDTSERTWAIRGPTHAKDEPLFRFYRAQRELMFVHAELFRRDQDPRRKKPATPFDFLWIVFDRLLPERWQFVPRLEAAFVILSCISTRQLRRDVKFWEARAEQLGREARLPPPGKEEYQFVNKVMKPILRQHGFYSLAQFNAQFGQET